MLYYRELRVGSLNLTAADRDGLAALLSGQAVSLAKLCPGEDRVSTAARVKEIARKSRENSEERGLETMSLAAGYATWRGEEGKRPTNAPVLLVPIAVNARERAGPTLSRSGEPQVNPVLQQVLASRFRCQIDPAVLLAAADTDPDRDDDPFNLDGLLAKLDELCRGVPEFGIRRTIYLGNFHFHKMAMVRDLRDHPEHLVEHDLIAALAGDVEAQARASSTGGAGGAEPDPRQFDQLPPRSEFLFLDADASQHKAIHVALGGRNAVVQGPPGTGKSQVIANLIVCAAAEGKRVLFVAEKRAALQVVLDRLARAQLGALALDLHGGETSRRVIAGRIRDALEYISKGEPVVSDAILSKFEDRRSRLNAHVARMHASRAPAGMSVFQLQGKLLRADPNGATIKTRFRGPSLLHLDARVAAEVKDMLIEACALGTLFLGTEDSPWTATTFRDGHAVQQAIDIATASADELWPQARRAIEIALAPHRAAPLANLTDAQGALSVARDVADFLGKYRSSLFGEDLPRLAAALRPAGRGWAARAWASIAGSAYRNGKATVLRHALSITSPQQMLADVRRAADLAARWRRAGFDAPTPIKLDVTAASNAVERLRKELATLQAISGCGELATRPPNEFGAVLEAMRDGAAVARRIPALRSLERRFEQHGLTALVRELREGHVEAARWPAAFERTWLQSCLEHALAEDPELAAFSGQIHGKFVEEFRELDRQRLELAAKRVAGRHVAESLKMLAALPAQAAVVRREAEKKMRHLPFRRLMEQAPDVLAALFPCLMCSPLSVSQLLPVKHGLFDLVIFDEASQVLAEDAVPALMRGTRAVVSGDHHQLPPTPFFADGSDEEDDDTDGPDGVVAAVAQAADATKGFESLLSMMSAFAPSPMLQWHYRSRDERLIAFSNHHIYGGRLTTFPSPGGTIAVEHILVKGDTLLDTGRDDSSSIEVARLVQHVLQHAERELARPDPTVRRSLGVIALGIAHARRVEAAIDRAREQRADLDEFFDPSLQERFFVKNLENVQGDERDIIMLTLGVLPDRAGRVSLTRFGPLNNREHGYRRLNVAITRARHRMILISAFAYHAIDASKDLSRGMELLRHYLEYADKGGRLPEGVRTGEPLNEFEADVADALAAHGVVTVPQWGMSGYRIDLVARHPRDPGRHVLAIECDGASYHSAPTARDRDRLRQQHLEALGWRFHRIWSTDWFNRREQEIRRALSAYEAAVAQADRVIEEEKQMPYAENAKSAEIAENTENVV